MFSATRLVASRCAGKRAFHASTTSNKKVALLGASGGIGQPMGLLLKNAPGITHLSLYDIVGTPGVAADLSHTPTSAKVTGHQGPEQVGDALKDADFVVIPAGVPRKPGMTRDDLFATNASIVKTLVEACSVHCPNAFIQIISNPVNSTVPIAAEVLKKAGCYNPKKLCGVTHLDGCRARTFVSEAHGLDPKDVTVPVIGGHAGITILPLLSQMSPSKSFDDEAIAALTHRIQFGGDEVVQAKDGAGSATLSMAFAGAEFLMASLEGAAGKERTECAFVESTVIPDLAFFATRVKLGADGVEAIHGTGEMTAFEKEGLEKLIPDLKAQIAKGVAFANQ